MYIVEFLIALIFIILLVSLPFIFKSVFKTRNFMGYSNGVYCSVLAGLSLFLILSIGVTIFYFLITRDGGQKKDSFEFLMAVAVFSPFFIILANIVIFFFIFYYTKGISNPNQPYNSVFMLIAGYLLPQFVFIYFVLILASLNNGNVYISRIVNFPLENMIIVIEFSFLLL